MFPLLDYPDTIFRELQIGRIFIILLFEVNMFNTYIIFVIPKFYGSCMSSHISGKCFLFE
jgi:hypothetical protein